MKVHAATVNRTDCGNLTGKPGILRLFRGLVKPRTAILGTDFAGEVVGIGADVRKWKAGDRVFGFDDAGLSSQAEYTVVAARNVYAIPDSLDYPLAAASLEGAHYAFTFLNKVHFRTRQNILVNGATGAIGSALLQFARRHDIHITATCNTGSIELIHSLGANTVVDYTKQDFTQLGGTYDLIFDAVGKSTFGRCKDILRDPGVYISSEPGPYWQNAYYAPATTWKSKRVIFPIPIGTDRSIPFIRDRLQDGTFQPVIDRTYALREIVDAYRYVISGQKTGNVLLELN